MADTTTASQASSTDPTTTAATTTTTTTTTDGITTTDATTSEAGASTSTDATGTGPGTTGAPETCGDGMLNGDETDLDCGGTCTPCDEGEACAVNDDCLSEACLTGTCLGAPECLDSCPPAMQACHESACVDFACVDQPLDDVACDDDRVCTAGDTCTNGVCESQAPGPVGLSAVAADPALGEHYEGGAMADLLATRVGYAGDFNGDGEPDFFLMTRKGGATVRIYVVFGGPTLATAELADIAAGVGGMMIEVDTSDDAGVNAVSLGRANNDAYADLLIGTSFNVLFMGKGGVYVVYGRDSTAPLKLSAFTPADGLKIQGVTMSNGFGTSLAGLGDLDGDDYADFAVGEPGYESNNIKYGAVHILYSGGNLISGTLSDYLAMGKAATIVGPNTGNDFGRVLAAAGDFNKSGASDLLVGDPNWGNGKGRAFVLYLPSMVQLMPTTVVDPPPVAQGVVITGSLLNSLFGTAIAAAGDFDGDTYADVVLGGPTGLTNRAYVVRGGPGIGGSIDSGLLVTQAKGFIIQGVNGDLLGTSVAGGLDINSDGISDLALGSTGGAGRVYVAFGSMTMPAMIQAANLALGDNGFRIDGEQANSEAGKSVALVPDLDGDGRAELLIGAPGHDGMLANVGRAYIVYGGDCHP